MPLSFHKWKKALHFKCLLDWIYMVCPIKLSTPARFSTGPQMMQWLMCWVWAACDSKHSSADRTRRHLDRRAAPENLSLSITYYKEHWGKVSTDLSCVGGWDLSEKPKELHRVNLQPAQMQKTHTWASYIIFNMSDHAQLLQHVEHLPLTHLSLLQYFSLHKHLGIGGGGKRRERPFLYRNFHALGSVN